MSEAGGGAGVEPETRLVGDIGATNARFGLGFAGRQDPALAQLSSATIIRRSMTHSPNT